MREQGVTILSRASRIAVLLPLSLAACEPAVLSPMGPVGTAEKTLIIDSLVIMLSIVLPTIVATLAFAWWFRAGNGRARRMPEWAYSGRVELVTWAIPLLTIVLLGGVTWVGAHELDPGEPLAGAAPLEIEAVALDWKWLFIYPGQHVASVNEAVVPAGRPLRLSITSASVLNTFFVPQLGGMIYAMNGMTSRLHLQADTPGSYRGISGHFSGDGFPGMHFEMRAVDPHGFDDWVASTRASGDELDRGRYTSLAEQSRDVKPFTFRNVSDGLFGDIVAQRIPPGPGPKEGLSGAQRNQVEH